MREIEFRGILSSDNTWVYGTPIFIQESIKFIKMHHCQDGQYYEDIILEETLGEYISFKDRNNTKMYEGDITEIISESGDLNRYVIKFGIVRRSVPSGWLVDIPSFYFDLNHGYSKVFPIVKNYKGEHDLESMVVIGNIYENPELLK